MRILVIDAQGGGIGSKLIEALRAAQGNGENEIVAVGTNVLATNAMRKAGADACATGENAAIYNAEHAGVILGPMGIIIANAMLGEISPGIAHAVSGSRAQKVLVPVKKCGLDIAGVKSQPMAEYIKEAADLALAHCRKRAGL